MDKHDHIIKGMEKMASSEGHRLAVELGRDGGGHIIIVFTAGGAQVYCRLSSFVKSPQIVLEPFCEELIKRMR